MLNKLIGYVKDPLGCSESLIEILQDTLLKIDAQIKSSKNKGNISILRDLYSIIEDTLLEREKRV